MHTGDQFKKVLAATIVAAAISPSLHANETWDTFTQNTNRVMPNPGMLVSDLRHFYGEPAITHSTIGKAETEVWDYGTFRSFVARGIVQRSELW